MLIQSIGLYGHANIPAAGQAQATERDHYELHQKLEPFSGSLNGSRNSS